MNKDFIDYLRESEQDSMFSNLVLTKVGLLVDIERVMNSLGATELMLLSTEKGIVCDFKSPNCADMDQYSKKAYPQLKKFNKHLNSEKFKIFQWSHFINIRFTKNFEHNASKALTIYYNYYQDMCVKYEKHQLSNKISKKFKKSRVNKL